MSIRCGDSLVGLTRKQIVDFNWNDAPVRILGQEKVEQRIKTALQNRREILEADENLVSPLLKQQKLDLADDALKLVREAGDLVMGGQSHA